MLSIRAKANSYLVMALILGALLPVMLDIAKGVNTTGFLFFAYLLGSVGSLAFVFMMGKQGRLIGYMRSWRDFAWIALIGIINYATLEYGLSYAERFISASLATVIYRTYPLLMLIFIPFVLRERVSKYQLAALLLAFAGLYIAFTGGSVFAFSGSSAGIIVFLVFVALAGALATLLVKRFMFDMESAMFIFNISNAVFFGILFVMGGASLGQMSVADIAALLYVGIIYNVFVGFMYYGALRMLKTTFVTNIYFLSPFLTFVFSAIILGEGIQAYYLIIAVLVSVGIIIQKFDRKGGTYTQKASSRATIYDVTSAFINSKEARIHAAIKSGGKVLAVKLSTRHRTSVDAAVKSLRDKGVSLYTDAHAAVQKEESDFIRDIVGAGEDEMVLMSAGNASDSENVLESLSGNLAE